MCHDKESTTEDSLECEIQSLTNLEAGAIAQSVSPGLLKSGSNFDNDAQRC